MKDLQSLPSFLERFESIRQQRAPGEVFAKAVERHILALLDNRSRLDPEDLKTFPELADTVVNYGMRHDFGPVRSETYHVEVASAIEEAIRRFEPRVSFVSVSASAKGRAGTVTFEVQVEVFAHPTPLNLVFPADWDEASGRCQPPLPNLP